MKCTIINLGTLAAVCAFSLTVSAAGVEVKPDTRVDEVATPGALNTLIKPTPASSGLNFNAPRVAAPTAAASTGQTCSMEDLATQLVKDTRISYADALAALKFWAGRVTVGTCHADAGGLISYAPEARENFLTAAIDAMNKMQGQTYTQTLAQTTWDNALASALGEDVDTAAGTRKQLQTNCGILAL